MLPKYALHSLLILVALPAIAQTPSTPHSPVSQLPAPGSPGIFIAAQQVADQLKAATTNGADPAVAELSVTDQYAIHEVHRAKAAPAAVHAGWTELHFILEGGGTLFTGGKMIKSGAANTIEGGVAQTVAKGDAVIIPPNTPHMYQQVNGTLTYLEVRYVAPTSAGGTK